MVGVEVGRIVYGSCRNRKGSIWIGRYRNRKDNIWKV